MTILIKGEFLTIGQLIKKIKLIDSGGQIKQFMQSHQVKINGKLINTRNTKVRVGDTIWIDDQLYTIKAQNNEE
ncbi:conserved hypothetical protein [Mycoplasmopsis pulmonis]|uniref:RNA-binding S4 domain-containing protein n=1 Tax=Mycoplasmopsis pulmonis (strain UAB CTIP) TaxID=272635 RepID=Q98RK5_MYCPU|nr:S4 domain-containing protein YaaA [Mycoplasmopsis pulmonis]MDZ7293373.1 S4 domain-containing protein YaaA [Mycoplasmopsis pulmonis]CAC13176.1 conserved hypothetical protein [Mycoplasmopsis pulmonis]VEU67796.1 s4-like RNA-binding protein [Mycoplasmopsis pulmonis]